MKLLVDECLSEELAKLARERGDAQTSHVRWIGNGGAKDWQLMPVILAGDALFGIDMAEAADPDQTAPDQNRRRAGTSAKLRGKAKIKSWASTTKSSSETKFRPSGRKSVPTSASARGKVA
jgi:hypothetical protein